MKKILIAALTLLSLSQVGCKNWLDINDDPNYVKEVEVNSLLPTAQMITASRVGYEYELIGGYWAQHTVGCATTSQYDGIMKAIALTNKDTYFEYPWRFTYVSVLPTLQTILEKCKEKDEYANYEMMAKTMMAFNLFMLTSAYGDIPYSEALQGKENLSPKYDSAEDIQKTMIGLLEEVLAYDPEKLAAAEAANSTATPDMIFAGDAGNWLKFANTLYLKLLMRDFTANKTKIEAALAGTAGFLDAKDAAFDHFSDAADKSNPLYESDRRQLNTSKNIRCCSDIFNVLDASDPRLSMYYDNDSAVPTSIIGKPAGSKAAAEESSRLRLAATDPVCFASISEAYFLQAEAYARLGDAAGAKSNYESAVTASFRRWGLESEAAAFIAGKYAFKSGSVEQMVEQIINQKWASTPRTQSWDAWFDINRTGYPAFGKVLTDYYKTSRPVRFFYPYASTSQNGNAAKTLPLTEGMWWHKK